MLRTTVQSIPPLFSICSMFYEDWAFVMDEERSSMLPTMAAGKLARARGGGRGSSEAW